MLQSVRVTGNSGAILWGYHRAASVKAWTIAFTRPGPGRPGRWRLSATFERLDPFALRQRPLLFTAARADLKGLWCWPLDTASIEIGTTQLVATLGPPEH